MNTEELLSNKKELDNVKDILRDTLSADPKALARLDSMNLDMNAIKTALDFLKNSQTISDKEKASLVGETWRITYRDRPPSPAEFLTEKYLGPIAKTTYDRIKKVFTEFMDPTKPYRDLFLYSAIGFGKALAVDEKVMIPTGFTEIKNIKIGDSICTTNGKFATVTRKLEFPEEDVYEMVFHDGRKVLACGNHNWKAHITRNRRYYDKETGTMKKYDMDVPCWKIITTDQIVEDLIKNPKHVWKFPITEPVKHKENSHLISPYILGAYLGDGCYSSTCTIVGDDPEIHDRIFDESDIRTITIDKTQLKEEGKSTVKYETRLSSEYKRELQRLNLDGCKCDTKFIPDEYLYDSIENRIALLQGLMDTDGTVNNNSKKDKEKGRIPHASFWTSSEQLKEDFEQLIFGLGGTVTTHFFPQGGPGTCNYDAWCINFYFPQYNFDTFYLPRKNEPLKEALTRKRVYKGKRPRQYLILKEIRKLDMKGGICIEVDSDDHCFLTNNYIVTHNSYCSALITLYIALQISLMRDPWKFFGLSPASMLCQFLCSYSLKKSSELLLEPFNAMLESSPYFEKVHTREKMVQANEEYEHMEHIDRLFYTTASPTSELSFAGGSNIKLMSNPMGLIGSTCVSIVFSEIGFWYKAGKALDLNEKLRLEDGSSKSIKDIQVGDKLYPLDGEENVVEKIMWEGEDVLYEIITDDGRTVKCNSKHLWPVKYYLKGKLKEEVVETQFMIDHPEIEFELMSI